MGKNRALKNVIVLISLIGCMMLLSGCSGIEGNNMARNVIGMLIPGGSNANNEVALAVVGVPHSNEPNFPLNAASIKDQLYNCAYTSGSTAFITNDGNAKVVYQTDIPKPEVAGLSAAKKKERADHYTGCLMKELSKLRAEAPEVDTLKGITHASKVLSGASDNANKILIVMDSGLTTSEYLNFTTGILNADTNSIIEALLKAEAIPDLTNVDIVWMYLGQTAPPQQELSETQKHKLEEVWRAILERANAKSIKFSSDISSEEPDSSLPFVSTVDVQNRSIDMELNPFDDDTWVLDNTLLEFIGDKAEFVDYQTASCVLKGKAELLLKHPEKTVYVVGTTASGNKDFCNQLSIDRANAVCSVLISYGVPESHLIPVGLGYWDPWHIEDVDATGKQIESYACQNRKVLIMDVNSEDAKKIQ